MLPNQKTFGGMLGTALPCRFCCKSRRGAGCEQKCATIESEEWIFRIKIAYWRLILNQCCSLGCAKSFCNKIGTQKTVSPAAGRSACSDVLCQAPRARLGVLHAHQREVD